MKLAALLTAPFFFYACATPVSSDGLGDDDSVAASGGMGGAGPSGGSGGMATGGVSSGGAASGGSASGGATTGGTSSGGSASGGTSSGGTGGGDCTAVACNPSFNSGPLGTAAKCFQISGAVVGWGLSNADGCTIQLNGADITGASGLTSGTLSFSDCDKDYASWHCY